ncbi:MAG TPA: hypothetical protein VLF71_04950 [Candidatus Saccharimonadales bacterium]|nr:hypothetical protein [Candidatus Saccharimonadales bacterium]
MGSSESTWGTVFKHGAACLALARGASAISAHPDSRPHARGDGAQFFIPPALREKVNVQLRQGDAPLLVLPGPPSLIGLGWKRGQDPSGVVMTLPQVEVAVWQYGEFPDRPSVLVHAGAGQDPNSSRADQRRFVAELQDTVPTTRTAIAPETIEQLGSAMVFAASELPPAQTTYYATGY